MSAFIGAIQSPHHNSPTVYRDQNSVWVSRAAVEIHVNGRLISQDPIAARNFAALLMRAADECERMRAKEDVTEGDGVLEAKSR